MRDREAPDFLVTCSIAFLCIGCSALLFARQAPPSIRVINERVERVSRDEVHFSAKVVNESAKPVFLEGSPFDSQAIDALYLEQWRAKEGWKVVVPCRDTYASDAIKLRPGEAITQERELMLPVGSVCKERNIHLEGKFRFRLDYFASKKEVRSYIKRMNSPGPEPPSPKFSVSDAFEIPPPKK